MTGAHEYAGLLLPLPPLAVRKPRVTGRGSSRSVRSRARRSRPVSLSGADTLALCSPCPAAALPATAGPRITRALHRHVRSDAAAARGGDGGDTRCARSGPGHPCSTAAVPSPEGRKLQGPLERSPGPPQDLSGSPPGAGAF